MDATDNTPRFVVAIHATPSGFYARVLDLPGCIARGATEVEALENARAAIRVFVAIERLTAQSKARVSLEISP